MPTRRVSWTAFPGLITRRVESGGANMKEDKNIFAADENDFIHSEELTEKYNINIGQQLNLLDAGKLTAYERLPGRNKPVFPSMDPDRWEKLTGKSVPDPYSPEVGEGLPVIVECKAEYRRLHTNEIGKLTVKEVTGLYFSLSEVETIAESIFKKENTEASLARRDLEKHVRKGVAAKTITSYDDLFHDPFVQSMQKKRTWANSTVRRYVQDCGIPLQKRGRKPGK